MPDDYEYFQNKRTDRVYLSRALDQKVYSRNEKDEMEEGVRPFRIVSKVIWSGESHEFIKEGKQVALRVTNGGRQEITAKFYEDTRGVFSLQIQKYTTSTGIPHKTYFSFHGNEIAVLYNFIRNIPFLPLKSSEGAKLDDSFVDDLVLSREQAVRLLQQQPELVEELVRSQITAKDVAELARRRQQLQEFKTLLSEPEAFEIRRAGLGSKKGPESVWQAFFERNTWIFGYGLSYVFNGALDPERLEQTVRGHDITGSGKRVDALLRTHGLVSALSFGEIKTHTAPLLKQVQRPYRSECWQVSDEVAGGIAQVQRSVQSSLLGIRSRLPILEPDGTPTGDIAFLYQPRSFLVVGSLSEFQTPHGINEEKYSSFELFRRHTFAPEIVTFDELYERARFIVESELTTS
jgi:hypothetical protein